jgi:DNA-binding CsgD family transcriptional regulator
VTIPTHTALTPRERQILERLLIGESTREIADAYGLSQQTVKNYVTVIYEKLGVSSRDELHTRDVQSRPLGIRGTSHIVRRARTEAVV